MGITFISEYEKTDDEQPKDSWLPRAPEVEVAHKTPQIPRNDTPINRKAALMLAEAEYYHDLLSEQLGRPTNRDELKKKIEPRSAGNRGEEWERK